MLISGIGVYSLFWVVPTHFSIIINGGGVKRCSNGWKQRQSVIIHMDISHFLQEMETTALPFKY